MSAPAWKRPRRIVGKTLVLRNADVGDSAFILALRTDEVKSRHMSPTPNDLAAQQDYLRRYAETSEGIYFIAESLGGEPLGTVRMYDARGDSFSWGSWIIKDGAPVWTAVESALMVYSYALDHLGFTRAHCMVRKDNVRVWTFHERFGAHRFGEHGDQYEYRIAPEVIRASLRRYGRFLPGPIVVEHDEPALS